MRSISSGRLKELLKVRWAKPGLIMSSLPSKNGETSYDSKLVWKGWSLDQSGLGEWFGTSTKLLHGETSAEKTGFSQVYGFYISSPVLRFLKLGCGLEFMSKERQKKKWCSCLCPSRSEHMFLGRESSTMQLGEAGVTVSWCAACSSTEDKQRLKEAKTKRYRSPVLKKITKSECFQISRHHWGGKSGS